MADKQILTDLVVNGQIYQGTKITGVSAPVLLGYKGVLTSFTSVLKAEIESTSTDTSRGFYVWDKRTTDTHQPSIAVASPSGADIFGMKWNASGTTAIFNTLTGNIALNPAGGVVSINGQSVVVTNDSRLTDARTANGGTADYLTNININSGDISTLYKTGSYSLYNTSNAPFSGDGGLINIPAWSGNDSDNRYNFQIAGSLNGNFYIRTTNQTGIGTWNTLYHNGNNIDLNNHCINISTTLSTNQSFTGTFEDITVGESVVFGDVLYLKFSDGKYWKAKADAYTTTPATRLALGSIAADASGAALIEGLIRLDSWSFAANNVWLSAATAGAITSTQPSTTGNQIQKIGVAFASNKLQFRPSFDIGEI